LSANEYKVMLASPAWCSIPAVKVRSCVVDRGISTVFDLLHIGYTLAASVKEALKSPCRPVWLSGLDPKADLDTNDVRDLRSLLSKGGKLLLLEQWSRVAYPVPGYIKGSLAATEGTFEYGYSERRCSMGWRPWTCVISTRLIKRGAHRMQGGAEGKAG